jgi:hypothetical protein
MNQEVTEEGVKAIFAAAAERMGEANRLREQVRVAVEAQFGPTLALADQLEREAMDLTDQGNEAGWAYRAQQAGPLPTSRRLRRG